MSKKTLVSKKKQGSTDFLIIIHFRQNSSYQGEIQWLNGTNKTKFFRSLLELILLLQEALDMEEELSGENKFRSWQDGVNADSKKA